MVTNIMDFLTSVKYLRYCILLIYQFIDDQKQRRINETFVKYSSKFSENLSNGKQYNLILPVGLDVGFKNSKKQTSLIFLELGMKYKHSTELVLTIQKRN